MDTSDEWIRQRTGIEQRRWISEGETPSSLAYEASMKALAKASLTPHDIDYLLVATLSPEHYFPGTCSFLGQKLGLGTIPGLDIRAQCSGFIYGLEMAKVLIESGHKKRILLVCVEVQSVALEKNDRGRDMAVLFGDGAAALVIERSSDPKNGIKGVITHLEGDNAHKLKVDSPSASHLGWIRNEDILEGRIHPQMDGKFVFKNAVTRMPEVIGELLQSQKLTREQVDFWLFHQANLRINEHVAQTLEIPPQKVYNNIQKYGNMSAASIPVALSEAFDLGHIKQGSKVVMTAFGAGFTWGSALVHF